MVAEGLVHAMAGTVFVPCIIYNVDNIMRLWTGLVSLSLFGSSFPFFLGSALLFPRLLTRCSVQGTSHRG